MKYEGGRGQLRLSELFAYPNAEHFGAAKGVQIMEVGLYILLV